ncbi:LysR family transcriptional regulator [Gluconobacter kanchanaburiensis]|uniref:LysR family transcriptional regulator n=1 Tax=Gluconobacter kanchanaburiensis NBRC 103587 TaxID=1307948 RepID=A0A511B9E8_9PROT|nr:LysR family transcriptional regulator [Gluconobacter kanchanaburiensis]MBF0862770.1 LysR family transcriptional regulator [Gluconobacter kanchanaburiensis]GBR68506.1 LysR family transcriptional regulator [Gluconobacter kanchanaburiensis NBRC 103587]GEK97049.1 LysR family transcriptional regulator [Gluconobacter kanchanaburiensis NBRC 103587]
MINHEDMGVFAQIASTGSLSKAARNLGISLTVVSKRLNRLERDLGVRLVNRSSRKTRLTDEGYAFIPMVRDILSRIEAAEASVSMHKTEVVGTLRVTATIEFASGLIAPILGKFLHQNPGLKIELISTDKLLDIVGENIDIAVRQAPLRDSGLVARAIAPDWRVLVASPDYIAQHGAPMTPADLATHRCIVLGDPPVTTWRLKRGVEQVSTDVSWTILSSDGGAAQGACIGGAGIALKSIWSARSELTSGRLVEVLPGWRPPFIPIQAVSASRHHQPLRVKAFIDFLRLSLQDELRTCPVLSKMTNIATSDWMAQ